MGGGEVGGDALAGGEEVGLADVGDGDDDFEGGDGGVEDVLVGGRRGQACGSLRYGAKDAASGRDDRSVVVEVEANLAAEDSMAAVRMRSMPMP